MYVLNLIHLDLLKIFAIQELKKGYQNIIGIIYYHNSSIIYCTIMIIKGYVIFLLK